ncbi:MAG: pyridoxamine 5'-phosphate oxidase family protein [Chloroflexota bacterium]
MSDTTNNLTEAYRAYDRLLTNQQSLMLATVNEDGSPLVSYSPYIVDEHKQFYIFVSQLAAHTANLRQRGEQVSLMLIEDEAAAAQVFARRRVTFQCQATPVARHSDEWREVIDRYRNRFGKLVDLLGALPDFQLFKLSPTLGRLVVGFGQAYTLSGEQLDTLTRRGRDDA